mmetsp:Transcript_22466/g.16968  ORF Transcript_22466/g.16968 Transcript_22466/m.16968 type:complete len:192 (+) Transcript_22466:1462-2037(+)
MKNLEDESTCEPYCDVESQERTLDYLNYLMLLAGSNKYTLDIGDFVFIYETNVTIGMTRYDPRVQGDHITLPLKFVEHGNRTVNITVRDSHEFANHTVLINAIAFRNSSYCRNCSCDGDKENATIVSELISLQLWLVSDEGVSYLQNASRVASVTSKDFQPAVLINFGNLSYNDSEVDYRELSCASYQKTT